MKYFVYLAGAIGCYYKEKNIEKANKWRIRAERYFEDNCSTIECINPCRFYDYGSNYHTSDFEPMRFDLRKVKESRVVLVNLEDLYRSLGTSDEIITAWLNDVPVVGFLEDRTLMDTVHSWKLCQIDRVEVGIGAQERAMEYIKNYYG